MVTEVWPPKVTARSVLVFTDEPEPRCATCTSPTVSGAAPKTLEIRTRAEVPAMLVCTICRSVWFPYEGPPLCGDTDHVPVQPSMTAGAAGAAAVSAPGAASAAGVQGDGTRANAPMASAAVVRTAPRLRERACRRTESPDVGGETEEDAWNVVRLVVRANPLREESSDEYAWDLCLGALVRLMGHLVSL